VSNLPSCLLLAFPFPFSYTSLYSQDAGSHITIKTTAKKQTKAAWLMVRDSGLRLRTV
jgi:hypothetical protein